MVGGEGILKKKIWGVFLIIGAFLTGAYMPGAFMPRAFLPGAFLLVSLFVVTPFLAALYIDQCFCYCSAWDQS